METWLQGMDGFSYCMEMLAAGRSQCDYAVFGQFINLSLFC